MISRSLLGEVGTQFPQGPSQDQLPDGLEEGLGRCVLGWP